ncbi:hypothetical protein [Hoeflea ulvae]|uniref:Uncharacterized protein n=1 Tax=Hoeflea ulvae TaxID=2983764 RepID=A0ABT3YKI9_9HYPH|nr:hypothetical protein [Hoeflea ulvae]
MPMLHPRSRISFAHQIGRVDLGKALVQIRPAPAHDLHIFVKDALIGDPAARRAEEFVRQAGKPGQRRWMAQNAGAQRDLPAQGGANGAVALHQDPAPVHAPCDGHRVFGRAVCRLHAGIRTQERGKFRHRHQPGFNQQPHRAKPLHAEIDLHLALVLSGALSLRQQQSGNVAGRLKTAKVIEKGPVLRIQCDRLLQDRRLHQISLRRLLASEERCAGEMQFSGFAEESAPGRSGIKAGLMGHRLARPVPAQVACRPIWRARRSGAPAWR